MTGEARELIRAVLDAPERASNISPAAVPAILGQLAALQALFLARLVAGTTAQANEGGPANGDRNLSVEEAAHRLGVKPGYLYRHSGRLPFTVRIGRRLLFSADGLERWNRRRQGR